MKLLTQILRPEHKAAGFYLEEDDHIVSLKRGNETLSRFWATKVTIKTIWDEADKYLNN